MSTYSRGHFLFFNYLFPFEEYTLVSMDFEIFDIISTTRKMGIWTQHENYKQV